MEQKPQSSAGLDGIKTGIETVMHDSDLPGNYLDHHSLRHHRKDNGIAQLRPFLVLVNSQHFTVYKQVKLKFLSSCILLC